MKIAFLGTYGAVPSPESGNTSLLVETKDRLVLIDTSGNPVQGILKTGFKPDELDVVVITHYHVDHLYAFPSLIHILFCLKRKKSLTVVAKSDVAEKVKSLLDFFGLNFKKIGFHIEYSDGFENPELSLFPGRHSVPSSMVRITKGGKGFLYTADTSSIESICEHAKGLDNLIHESSGPHERIGKLSADEHSSGYQAGLNARCAGVKRLFLCHFGNDPVSSPERMRSEAAKSFKGEIIIPIPYKLYEL